ncbi:hypothetical protein [Coprobacter fastidiosus]|uniref:hypothetical protein n=1 Tax=Coprobacter fastidiosus TaxID=1099853 RepID=UPI00266F1451|nr:hypothetical protein [Coprobacter fastidiosus]
MADTSIIIKQINPAISHSTGEAAASDPLLSAKILANSPSLMIRCPRLNSTVVRANTIMKIKPAARQPNGSLESCFLLQIISPVIRICSTIRIYPSIGSVS